MKVLLLTVFRPIVSVAVLVVVYYLLPLDRPATTWTVVRLILAPCLVIGIIVWQVRMILRSAHPVSQGVQALALIVPVFLLSFAIADVLIAHNQPHSFSQPLDKTDALYFVLVVFTTVGFGDITPVSDVARIVVIVQMVGDLLVLGVVLRVIVTAVQHAKAAMSSKDLSSKDLSSKDLSPKD